MCTGGASSRLLHSVNHSPIVMKMSRMLSHDFPELGRDLYWLVLRFRIRDKFSRVLTAAVSLKDTGLLDRQWRATLLTMSAPHVWLPLWPDPRLPGVVSLPMPRSVSRSACSTQWECSVC